MPIIWTTDQAVKHLQDNSFRVVMSPTCRECAVYRRLSDSGIQGRCRRSLNGHKALAGMDACHDFEPIAELEEE